MTHSEALQYLEAGDAVLLTSAGRQSPRVGFFDADAQRVVFGPGDTLHLPSNATYRRAKMGLQSTAFVGTLCRLVIDP